MLSEFEYANLKKEVDYFSSIYFIDNKEFNGDFIFSDALNRYIKYKEKVDFLKNEKIICSVIKSISKRATLDFKFKNINYNTTQIKDDYPSDIIIDEIIAKNITNYILYTIYSTLTESEQALFDFLSDNDVSKNKACKLLGINTIDYDRFISKLRKILQKFCY